MRICFFGDSFVNGTGDDECQGWPGRICAEARRAGFNVTLYNLGVRGDASNDIAARWRREAEARLPSGLDGRLVFSFGTNDCAPAGAEGVRIPHAQALCNARAILTAASRWRPTLMVGPAPVSDDPPLDLRVKALSNILADVCDEIGVAYLPVFNLIRANEAWSREARLGDGTHPSSGGYAALARLVAGWPAWKAWFASRPDSS